MKKLKDSQFIRIITKIKNKLFENKKEIGFFLCLVVVGIFFVVHSAEAQTISDIKSGIIDAFSDFLNLLNKVVVEGINFLFEFFLSPIVFIFKTQLKTERGKRAARQSTV